jgi:hypothetical protein
MGGQRQKKHLVGGDMNGLRLNPPQYTAILYGRGYAPLPSAADTPGGRGLRIAQARPQHPAWELASAMI